MTGAFLYLSLCSIRNAIVLRVRRLRQLRYALIAVGVAVYVGSLMLRGDPPWAGFTISPAYAGTAQVIGSALALLMLTLAWILPGSVALRFTPAEVQFLFPAPVSRRQLIAYKVVRLLLGAVATGMMLTVFVGPRRLLPSVLFLTKTTIIFAILAMHEAGVSLYRKNAADHGGLQGARRMRVLLFAGVLTPVAAWITTRFALSSGGAEFWRALPLALVVLAANVLWVLRSDAAFEEAAADAAEMARRRPALVRAEKRRKAATARRYTLAPRGPIEIAILWKNWMLLGNTGARVIAYSTLCVLGITAGRFTLPPGLTDVIVTSVCAVIVGVLALFGPVFVRVDLRQDLAHLELIKTWPARGAAIVRGELLAPTLALSAGAVVPIALGSAIAPSLIWFGLDGAGGRLLFGVSALLVTVAIVVAQLVIQNGIAVTFPAWIKLTPAGGDAAVETMGQTMVVMYGSQLVLAIVALVPAAAATLAYFIVGGVLIPATAFAALLLAESLVATELLGRVFERTDLQDLAVAD